MSASTNELHGNGAGVLIGGLIILGILVVGIVSIGASMEGLTVSPHAEEKHGVKVQSAASYLDSGGPVHREDCRDNKKMWTWRMNGQQWVAIVKGRTIVTMFETSQEYLDSVRKRDGCGDGLQLGGSHDVAY